MLDIGCWMLDVLVDEGRKEPSRRAGAALSYLSALACELQGF